MGWAALFRYFIPDEELARVVHRRLEALGVEIRTGAKVSEVDAKGVVVNGERILSRSMIWTAGVTPSPVAQWLSAATDKAGRVIVDSNCEVPGLPGMFVIGDAASFDVGGKPLPGLAQVAIQQGRYVASVIAARFAEKPAPPPFRYMDKGNMAVVGRNFAVLEIGGFRQAGFFAWVIWATVAFFSSQQQGIV